jgi:hypothetical protein
MGFSILGLNHFVAVSVEILLRLCNQSLDLLLFSQAQILTLDFQNNIQKPMTLATSPYFRQGYSFFRHLVISNQVFKWSGQAG